MKSLTLSSALAGFMFLSFFFAVPGSARAAQAPRLSVGEVKGSVGGVATVPILFSAGKADVTALEFALTLPSGWTIASSAAGPTAQSAGKSVMVSTTTNVGIVFGMNAQKMNSGVVAMIAIKIPSGISSGAHAIMISKESYSDRNGKSIKGGSCKNGSITVALDYHKTGIYI